MSTVIIGGGDDARAAINDLEQASLTMSDEQRGEAEAALKAFTAQANELAAQCRS